MPKYNVVVLRTVVSQHEMSISAKDEQGAIEKAEAKIQGKVEAGTVDKLDWESENSDGEFEYDAQEE